MQHIFLVCFYCLQRFIMLCIFSYLILCGFWLWSFLMQFIFMWNGFSQSWRMIAGSGWLSGFGSSASSCVILWSIHDLRGLCSSLLSRAHLALSFGPIVPVLFHLYSISTGFPCHEAVPARETILMVLRVGKAHPASALETSPWKDPGFYFQFSSSLILSLLHFPLRIWGELGALLFPSPLDAPLPPPLCSLSHRPRSHGTWSFCSCRFLCEFISNRPLSVGLTLLNWEWGENHCKLASARYLRDITGSRDIFYISFSAGELLDHVSDCKPAWSQAQR